MMLRRGHFESLLAAMTAHRKQLERAEQELQEFLEQQQEG
jgi:hypothetical protein